MTQSKEKKPSTARDVPEEVIDLMNELYVLSEEIEQRNGRRKQIKETLIPLLKENRLDTQKFAIGNRHIRYKLDTTMEGLTQKLLKTALSDYYQGNPGEAIRVYKHILNSRSKKSKEVIDVTRRE